MGIVVYLWVYELVFRILSVGPRNQRNSSFSSSKEENEARYWSLRIYYDDCPLMLLRELETGDKGLVLVMFYTVCIH